MNSIQRYPNKDSQERAKQGDAKRSPPKETKAEEPWKLTPDQIQKELDKWKDSKSPQAQALLCEKDIWDMFKNEDKEGFAKDILQAGVKFATGIACSGGPPGLLIEAATDLMKEKFAEKGTSHGVLVKKLSCNVLVFAVLVAAGTSVITAGASAIAGTAFALHTYLDRRDAKKYEKMQADIAKNMVATYNRIKKESQEKLDDRNRNKIERLLLSSSKQDWEDDHGHVVATYWSGRKEPFGIIQDYHLKQLVEVCPDASKLITYRQAQIWLAHRKRIKRSLRTLFAGQGSDDTLRNDLKKAVADYLEEQQAEAQITEGNYLALPPKVSDFEGSGGVQFALKGFGHKN
ncbi:hypothetical protein JMJ35_009470 [Cladonia borealis]|uniref:Uncharacterized protein n=1 Tax=Cladonia borealis TaxID=184061 RepID=A0AA39QV22_9LECA|nr:hypothetical protein JMJ35_009470 [Cladonia borealis]